MRYSTAEMKLKHHCCSTTISNALSFNNNNKKIENAELSKKMCQKMCHDVITFSECLTFCITLT